MIDYARIENEISRIMDELENIPLADESRPELIDELKSYEELLSKSENAKNEAKQKRKDRIAGIVKTSIMSGCAIIAIGMTTSFEKEGIITSKAWQIATKLIPIAKA